MKRKYYLRGLGIGILVTALVFIYVKPNEITDAEIIKRAEALGYVKAEENVNPTISLKELMETETPSPSPEPTVMLPEETVTPVPVPVVEENSPTPETEVITARISVKKGDRAGIVCDKLQEAGIIADAKALKTYIIERGVEYDVYIGTFTFSSDMTYEEIVKILTGK